ncbi:hypothetical protein BGHDH14_bgh05393 [Blumeria hordei DH14]|uniref:DNA-directed DNA polymerase n=1 Tax=Blumeria graminis f. sp. hordei (strain DH14) TaxID=546991 RepID=N1JES7_BLUG1|nr:hypothetical protein BGHDH14_bgh05393 [Blumeria hordei DH14]
MQLSVHDRHLIKPCMIFLKPSRLRANLVLIRKITCQYNTYATENTSHKVLAKENNFSLSKPSIARYNEIGVQQLSSHVFSQIFPKGARPPPTNLVELSRDHLKRHELLGKNTDNSPPIAFDLPELQGSTLDEHFYKLGMDSAEPYLSLAKILARSQVPKKPLKWIHRSGWTKYYPDGRSEAVDTPNEEILCFDTEVLWKESPFAVMACAVSPTNWYAWLSPWLLGETENDKHLIPLGDPKRDRVIVGHNIGYDRARTAEEYDVVQSRNNFLDTMSLHVAVNGMCTRQRPTWMKHRKNRELRDKIAGETDSAELANLLEDGSLTEEEELWVGKSSVNSLQEVAEFHLGVILDKSERDAFSELSRAGIMAKLDRLLDYCATDVDVTHRIFKVVFNNFLETCPHPVSFAALRHLSSVILPVDRSWETYISNAETTYKKMSDGVQERLISLAEKALALKENPEVWENDPWLRQLDWSGQEIKMVKGKKKGDPPRPAKQKMPGCPKWYKDLFSKVGAPISLSVRTRIAPILLRLSWNGNPMVWSDKYGWTFRVPINESDRYPEMKMQKCTDFGDKDNTLKLDTEAVYFKLPHKDGPLARCVSPMAKSYLTYFENGALSSEFTYAKEALEMNASCSYWIGARMRIMSQMVVYECDGAKRPKVGSEDMSEIGFILPQIIPMGTITRRAVEKTWLTASNAKKNRVGSELKSMVKAPPGYVFVGADVDSEELWIASLIGDAQFKLHGGNAVGFMTLEGTKAAGTDLHSRTASILGITRNDAKIFNYGRIYGAGLNFASKLLRQFNPNLSENETSKVAGTLYKATKGIQTNHKILRKRSFWRGGTESFVFNKLEDFAEQEKPRTPVLGAGITEALMRRNVNPGGFMTSRINWAIQSSGVDYLHLIIVAMDYLIRRFNLDARIAITVHDEIRYLVLEKDRYRAAMAMQIANVWTRAMFSQQVGINDLPQSCAFFSAVDIDHVLRKEVNMDCITPSHHTPIPHGESIDITTLLTKPSAFLDQSIVPSDPPDYANVKYEPRTPVMESLVTENDSLTFLKAQITGDDVELRGLVNEQRDRNETRSTSKSIISSKKRQILPYSQKSKLIEEPTLMRDPFDAGKSTWRKRNWALERNISQVDVGRVSRL